MAGNLMRFDPLRDIARFDPFREFDEMLRDFSPVGWRAAEGAPRIRMDVSETDNEYVVHAEVPGVNKDDIKVAINGNQVSLTAEIRDARSDNNANALRNERYYGQVYRNFTLPQDVDEERAEAKCENGVLQLTLPKKTGSGGKQLSIQ